MAEEFNSSDKMVTAGDLLRYIASLEEQRSTLRAGCAEAKGIIERLYRDVFPTHTIKWETYAPLLTAAMEHQA